jgi:Fe-S-cluster containining protein
MNIDFSELKGRRFKCLKNCALCCSFQPELIDSEIEFFTKNKKTTSAVLVNSKGKNKRYFFKLQKGRGACIFLKDRQCSIFDIRPWMCRQFPFQVYVGETIQVNCILSCRGLWINDGEDAMGIAKEAMLYYGHSRLKQELLKTRKRYEEFRNLAKTNNTHIDRSKAVGTANLVIPLMTQVDSLRSILTFIENEESLNDVNGKNILSFIRKTIPEIDIEAVCEDNCKRMLNRDVPELPTYATPSLQWHILSMRGEEILELQLIDNGNIRTIRTAKLHTPYLRTLDKDSKKTLTNYLYLINNREKTYGDAANLILPECSVPIIKAYLYTITTHAINIWLRAEMFSALEKKDVSRKIMEEAIISYDSECYSPQTLGAVI